MATVVGACDCVCCCDQDGVCRYDVTVSVTANGSYADPGDPTAVGQPPTGASFSTAWSKTDVVEGECNHLYFVSTQPCAVNYSSYVDGPGGEEGWDFDGCPDDSDPWGLLTESSGCNGPDLVKAIIRGGFCYQLTTKPLASSTLVTNLFIQNGQLVVSSLDLHSFSLFPADEIASSATRSHLIGSASVTFKGKTKTLNLFSDLFFNDATNGTMSVLININISQKVGS